MIVLGRARAPVSGGGGGAEIDLNGAGFNGFGITAGSDFFISAEVTINDITNLQDFVFNPGGDEYWGFWDAPNDRFYIYVDAAADDYGTLPSWSGLGWVAGTTTATISVVGDASARSISLSVDDGTTVLNTTIVYTDVSTYNTVATSIQVFGSKDGNPGFDANVTSLTVNTSGTSGGDTFTGTVAEWNAGSASAPQFTTDGTVVAA